MEVKKEQQIGMKNHEGYTDPTPYQALRNIMKHTVPDVVPGNVYHHTSRSGVPGKVLVLGKNESVVTALFMKDTDDYGAVEVYPGAYTCIPFLTYTWITNIGGLVRELEPGQFERVKQMIAGYLLLEKLPETAAAPANTVPVNTVPAEPAKPKGKFARITDHMVEVYEAKNHDYGNAFTEMRDEFPETVLIYLTAKLKRLKALIKGEDARVSESIEDTLMDMANYCVMELMERVD